jgi:hypothetical protein
MSGIATLTPRILLLCFTKKTPQNLLFPEQITKIIFLKGIFVLDSTIRSCLKLQEECVQNFSKKLNK